MPQLGDHMIELLLSSSKGGWSGVASFAILLGVLAVLYYKRQQASQKMADDKNAERQHAAGVKNTEDNKADEINLKKAENDIEEVLKGGN